MSKPQKHSVLIHSHRTSFTLEDEFWIAFQEIADKRGQSIGSLITEIDDSRKTNLSCAIRIFVLKTLQEVINQKQS